MDFEEVIRSRRTVRHFATREVPDELVRTLVDCAVRAPSSMNGQPWSFIVIRNKETKQRLAEMKDRYCPPEKREYPAGFLVKAPVVVVTCVDRATSYDRGLENGVLATAHLLLAAANHGLTGVYMSAYKDGTPAVAAEIRSILNIPAHVDPITLVPIGYPGETAETKTIKSPGEVIFHEAFGRK